MQRADSMYAQRHVGFDSATGLARRPPVDSALDLYRTLARNPSGLDREKAMWKWLRAMYYKGAYATSDPKHRMEVYESARRQGETWLEEYPDSAPIEYWVAILWGVWGEGHGIWTAARKGIGGKMRKHARHVLELDSLFEGGGAFRLLGRLHFKAPRIPILHNWPSKDKALSYLERSYAIDSLNPFTRLFLAESLHERGFRNRARKMLELITRDRELRIGVLEDARARRDAEALRREWETEDP